MRYELNGISIVLQSSTILSDIFTVFSPKNMPENCSKAAFEPLDEEVDMFWSGLEHYITRKVRDVIFISTLIISLKNQMFWRRSCLMEHPRDTMMVGI